MKVGDHDGAIGIQLLVYTYPWQQLEWTRDHVPLMWWATLCSGFPLGAGWESHYITFAWCCHKWLLTLLFQRTSDQASKKERNPFPTPSPNLNPSFVGGELSFLKLGSFWLVWVWVCWIFLRKANKAKIAVFLRLNVCFGLQPGFEVVPGQIHM